MQPVMFFVLGLLVSGVGALSNNQTPDADSVGTSLTQRISGRSFPSVFQAWNRADNLPEEDPIITLTRHDLYFHSPLMFGLQWNNAYQGLATGFTLESVQRALRMRQTLLQKNPNMVLLAEIRYRDAARDYLPEPSLWWKRDELGIPEMGWAEGQYIKLDYANPEYQQQVATQARAALDSGVFDGVMLDWWQEDDVHLELIARIRKALGKKALILVNGNDRQLPLSAKYINGVFMECYRSDKPEDWRRIEETLSWAEANLCTPRINCLETWYHTSRNDLNLMRATTCLSLVLSNGYCLFSDPNPLPTPDHLHNWYPFWEKTLGKPRSRGARRPDGMIRRDFERGAAVYNPMGNGPQTIWFRDTRLRASTGELAKKFTLSDTDGDLFLVTTPHG